MWRQPRRVSGLSEAEVLKGHGLSRAVNASKSSAALAAVGTCFPRYWVLGTRYWLLGTKPPDQSYVNFTNNPCPPARNPLPYALALVMFNPHPNLADDVNHAIIQSEIEGGVFLHDLPPSTILHIQTMHHCYTAVLLGGSDALISGHPEFCPDPVQVAIAGSTWGGSMLKLQYVGRGMHLEFRHPEYATPIVTSPIQEIRDSQPLPVAPAMDSLSY
jgi:hypothetical protein